VQGPATEDGFLFSSSSSFFFFRIARAKGFSRATPVFPLRSPVSRSALLFEYGTGEMTFAEYQSHREGIFIDRYLDSDGGSADGSAVRVWSAFSLLRAFPLTPFGSHSVFLIGNFRRQRGGILMAWILIRLELIRSLRYSTFI
jgi:hypothetical protein